MHTGCSNQQDRPKATHSGEGYIKGISFRLVFEITGGVSNHIPQRRLFKGVLCVPAKIKLTNESSERNTSSSSQLASPHHTYIGGFSTEESSSRIIQAIDPHIWSNRQSSFQRIDP